MTILNFSVQHPWFQGVYLLVRNRKTPTWIVLEWFPFQLTLICQVINVVLFGMYFVGGNSEDVLPNIVIDISHEMRKCSSFSNSFA